MNSPPDRNISVNENVFLRLEAKAVAEGVSIAEFLKIVAESERGKHKSKGHGAAQPQATPGSQADGGQNLMDDADDKAAAPPGRGQPSIMKGRTLRVAGRFDSAEGAARVPTPEEMKDMRTILQSESDRGCLLSGQAILDDALGFLLYRYFIAKSDDKPTGREKRIRKLFQYEQAAGAFSARVNLAYALGLIDDPILETLEDIREMRNHVAHHPSEFSFEQCRLEGFWQALSHEEQMQLANLEGVRRFTPPEYVKGTLFEKPNRRVFEIVCLGLWIRIVIVSRMPDDPKQAMKIFGERPEQTQKLYSVVFPNGYFGGPYQSRSGASERTD